MNNALRSGWFAAGMISWLWLASVPVFGQDDEGLILPDYPPIETFDPISQRPLFNATRRPKPKAEDFAQDTSQSELLEKWHLVGIILHKENPLALISEKTGDQRLTLSQGMPLDQTWTLSEIGQDYIVVEGNNEETRMELWQPRERQAPKAARSKRADAQPGVRSGQAPKANTGTQRTQGAPVRATAPRNTGTNGG